MEHDPARSSLDRPDSDNLGIILHDIARTELDTDYTGIVEADVSYYEVIG